MSGEVKPCHCGYSGALAGIDHQAGCYLSLACPECNREVTAFTMGGLVDAWNKPAEHGHALTPVCAAAPNIAPTSEHSGS